jgi:hypothetical protein
MPSLMHRHRTTSVVSRETLKEAPLWVHSVHMK